MFLYNKFFFYSTVTTCVCFKHVSIRNGAGLEIATDMVTNATNISSFATKNSSLVASLRLHFSTLDYKLKD